MSVGSHVLQCTSVFVGGGSFINPVLSLLSDFKSFNLGVVLNSNLSLSDHVYQITQSTRVHTTDLYKICHILHLKT